MGTAARRQGIDQKAKDTSRYVAMLVCEGVVHV